MPNGGMHYCDTCWFNTSYRFYDDYRGGTYPVDRRQPDVCTIRRLLLEDPAFTACANFRSAIAVPIGPVYSYRHSPRRVVAPSPDTEEIRAVLLAELQASLAPRPSTDAVADFGTGWHRLLIWQVGELREQRAAAALIWASTFTLDLPGRRGDRSWPDSVAAAQEALAKLRGEVPVEYPAGPLPPLPASTDPEPEVRLTLRLTLTSAFACEPEADLLTVEVRPDRQHRTFVPVLVHLHVRNYSVSVITVDATLLDLPSAWCAAPRGGLRMRPGRAWYPLIEFVIQPPPGSLHAGEQVPFRIAVRADEAAASLTINARLVCAAGVSREGATAEARRPPADASDGPALGSAEAAGPDRPLPGDILPTPPQPRRPWWRRLLGR